ncbi:MAG: DUF2892 domain-containing protein [Rhodospirillales bacterium]|jgi:hypothetical protein|nr:DUF2892 domain-containing protein [Rhodospirillales bacterium]
MKKNVGGIDRAIRAIAGIVLLGLMVVLKDESGYWLWGLLGLVPLGTAAIGWCPPYAIFGISSCKTEE